jgi:DNA-binding transcriptional LysR family regulator
MHISQIDLNLLVVFDVIYAERNLTRASELLHITQPAVSNALGRLRRTFDDPLFVRTSEGMTPTPAARNIIDRVRKSIQLIESCIDHNEAFDPLASDQTLRCSFSEFAEAMLLPGLLARIRVSAPNMALRSYYVPRNEMPIELAAGTIDIGVDVTFVNDSNLHHAPLLDEEYVCVVRQDHPTIKRKPTMKQYLSLGHVHVSSRRKGVGTVDQSLKTLGHRRTIAARVGDYTAAPLIVAKTDLACTLPRAFAKQAGLRAYTLPFETPSLSMHMYWHKSANADAANAWLRGLVAEVANTT